MAVIEKTIEVQVPLRTAYNQWTQFEEFPLFMDGVEEITQLDDVHLLWKARVGGAKREWRAKVIEQVPDQRVAWTSVEGTRNAGQVSFEPVGANCTRVTLELDFQPEGVVETIGDKLGMVERKAEADLERFRDYIEERGAESGAWRGEVRGGVEVRPDSPESGMA
jgi:uncharacterized membrane protein